MAEVTPFFAPAGERLELQKPTTAAGGDVASLRKTWHVMGVGAAVLQGRIASIDDPLGEWLPELEGEKRRATWRRPQMGLGFGSRHE